MLIKLARLFVPLVVLQTLTAAQVVLMDSICLDLHVLVSVLKERMQIPRRSSVKVRIKLTRLIKTNYSSIQSPLGCHASCKTCSGSLSTNCLSCDASSQLPYFYNFACYASCPSGTFWNTSVSKCTSKLEI